MKVVYTAPNRAHHFRYAKALMDSGILSKFVSGFSRFSPRNERQQFGDKIVTADWLQNVYLLSQKLRNSKLSRYIAYLAKIEQDLACGKFVRESDIFLFYNGSGLSTMRKYKDRDIKFVTECVNTHIGYQEDLLKEEYKRLGLTFHAENKLEKKRREAEYEESDYLMVPSQFARRSFLEKGFSAEKIFMVPYGFDAVNSVSLSDPKNKEGVFTILYVGTVSVRKGIRYLVEAFKKIKHPRKQLKIVGPIAETTGLEDMSLPDNIKLTGTLKGEDLKNAYRNAQVFCLPSIEDGFGLVVGEALAYGLPIVATKNTGAPDIVRDGVEGYIVNAGRSEELLEAFNRLIDDAQKLNEISDNALKASRSLNGWGHSAEALTAAMRQVLAQ